MLTAQFGIGVVNDLYDRGLDAETKPDKPLVSGVVGAPLARRLAIGLVAMSLVTAATFGGLVFVATVVVLGAGLGYDVGLKRSGMSWVPWWLGFSALPAVAFAAVGQLSARVLVVVPIAALLAVGLHCANALPDIAADQAGGLRSLPVRLGERRARHVAWLLPAAAALAASAITVTTARPGPLTTLTAATGIALPVLLLAQFAARRPFPIAALAFAVFGALWLGTLT